MAKRYQTYFGVPIPPFKEDKLGAGSITIRFVITGKIPSKKNNQMSVSVRRYAREWAKKKKATNLFVETVKNSRKKKTIALGITRQRKRSSTGSDSCRSSISPRCRIRAVDIRIRQIRCH